ncbi:hypothetical protein TNCV_1951511 [Trichonephila clavipes]|nr:hypothetical protein TNCV_1951511 [Trichonephila clavipes]
MDVCKCIVPLRHGGTSNSRRAASPLVRFVEGEERWEDPDHPRGFSLKIGLSPRVKRAVLFTSSRFTCEKLAKEKNTNFVLSGQTDSFQIDCLEGRTEDILVKSFPTLKKGAGAIRLLVCTVGQNLMKRIITSLLN